MDFILTVSILFTAVVFILLRKLWVLLARFCFYYGTIWFERNILAKFEVPLRFPRNQIEIWNDRKRFFNFLKNINIVPTVSTI